MFDYALVTYLQEWPGLASVINGRVYPWVLPQEPTIPAMVYRVVSNVPAYSHDGYSGLDEAVYQFDCWGRTPVDATNLAVLLRDALQVPQFGWLAAFVESMMASTDTETGLSRMIVMVRFQYNS